MKKLVFGIVASLAVFNSSYGQNSTNRAEGKYLIIEASNLKSNINEIITEVKVTNKEKNISLPIFLHKFISLEKTDLKKDFENNSKTVSGISTIEVDGQIVYQRILKNGVFEKPQIYEFVGTTVLGKEYECTVQGNLTCVSDRIQDMNPVEYGFCLAGAPACLSELYLSCAWDNCM